jgi:hypothetical protein
MLVLIVGNEKINRRVPAHDVVPDMGAANMYDDTMLSFADLEQFAYPSLFESMPPVIWAQFILDKEDTFTKEKIAILANSKTIFIIEEFAITADTKKIFEKHGAQVFVQKKESKTKEYNPLFSIVEGMVGVDKKSRWMAYQKALAEDIVPEALMGVLYWKLRQQCGYAKGDTLVWYKKLYTDFIQAHAHAWKSGTPLALMIEKVLLQ